MRDRNENRATRDAYEAYTVHGYLLMLAIVKWMDVCLNASLAGKDEFVKKATRIFEEYALSTLPKIIEAKKFMEVDFEKDQWFLNAIKQNSGDSIGVYSLEDILKEFTKTGDK